MEDCIRVNGIKAQIITRMSASKIIGLRSGSILVIYYDCEIPTKAKHYLDYKKIKILRLIVIDLRNVLFFTMAECRLF